MKFKTIFLLSICLLCASAMYAQDINFTRQKSWAEVQELAKSQGRYIFVDIGATWCVPCYLMEKVFKKPAVADFYNDNFISYRVQADSTKKDSQEIRDRYADTKEIITGYDVYAYPSFLFISPNGNLVSRGWGLQTADQFIALGKAALHAPDIKKPSFKEELETARHHELPAAEMREFAMQMLRQGDNKHALEIAAEYDKSYLAKATTDKLADTANLRFIYSFHTLIQAGDTYFAFLLQHGALLDRLAGESGYSDRTINRIISKTEVHDELYSDGNPVEKTPAWNDIEASLATKYGPARAKKIMLYEMMRWYTAKKQWPEAIKLSLEYLSYPQLDTSEFGGAVINNQVSFYVLEHSNDVSQLNEGVSLIDTVIRSRPAYYEAYDTRSRLLYKLGRKKDAIKGEKQVIKKIRHDRPENRKQLTWRFKSVLNDIKAGRPISN